MNMKIKISNSWKIKRKVFKRRNRRVYETLGAVYEARNDRITGWKTPDRASDLENQQILEKEGNRILSKIGDRDFVITLAIEGQQFPSERFSQVLEEVTVRGYSDITFVIGGSLGLSPAVKKRSNLLMSFGN